MPCQILISLLVTNLYVMSYIWKHLVLKHIIIFKSLRNHSSIEMHQYNTRNCWILCCIQTCSLPTGTTFVPSCSLLCSWDLGLCDDWECGFSWTGAVTFDSDDLTLRGCLALPRCLASMTFTSPSGLRWVILDGTVTPAAAIFAPLNNNYH